MIGRTVNTKRCNLFAPQWSWGVSILVLLLSACAEPRPLEGSAQQAVRTTLEEAGARADARGVEVPDEINRALLPPVSGSLSKKNPSHAERRFDVVANNAPTRDVLVGLAEGTPYSVVVHPDVSGNITLDLKNVTLPEALDVVRNAYGYDFERTGNRITVYGTGLRTRIYPVNYLNFGRRGISRTNVAATDLRSGGSGDSGSSSSGSSTGSSSSGSSSGGSGAAVETETIADFWSELKKTLESLIGTEDSRNVVVNPQASLIIVRAKPFELDVVEQYLGLTHETVNRQVVLEAKILEVELREGFQSGINWAGVMTPGNNKLLVGQTGGGTVLSGSGTSEIGGELTRLDPDDYFEIDSTIASAFGGVFSVAVKGKDFAGFVEALQTQGDVHVLSSPRVSTVNNQKAVIKVGGDEFFITGIKQGTSTTTSGGTTTTEPLPEVTLSAFFSGIALDVTPQIDAQENIILHIHPSISEVTQRNKSFILGDRDYSLPLAASNIQESDNVVRARSGQIVVIGGLMKEASTEQTAGVPLLGSLPLIGALFRHQKVVRVKKELVILLKPTVIVNGDRMRPIGMEPRDRVVNFTRDTAP